MDRDHLGEWWYNELEHWRETGAKGISIGHFAWSLSFLLFGSSRRWCNKVLGCNDCWEQYDIEQQMKKEGKRLTEWSEVGVKGQIIVAKYNDRTVGRFEKSHASKYKMNRNVKK